MLQNPTGIVYLMGAGPGDVSYLTVQARDILAIAQVLVYDALVDDRLLDLVPADCQTLAVGKRGGQPSTPQAEINQLLVHYGRQQRVVRLKSGDPFIFGRCMAEIQALQAAGCAFEVVPGLSSALTAPLLAGIPLTDPVLSRSFAVATAHDPDALNWTALAQLDTVVLLMATRSLADIVDRLIHHGRSPKPPSRLSVGPASRSSNYGSVPCKLLFNRRAARVLSPAVVVVGEVVGLRPFIQPEPPVS